MKHPIFWGKKYLQQVLQKKELKPNKNAQRDHPRSTFIVAPQRYARRWTKIVFQKKMIEQAWQPVEPAWLEVLLFQTCSLVGKTQNQKSEQMFIDVCTAAWTVGYDSLGCLNCGEARE